MTAAEGRSSSSPSGASALSGPPTAPDAPDRTPPPPVGALGPGTRNGGPSTGDDPPFQRLLSVR